MCMPSLARAETLGFAVTRWHIAGQFTADGKLECPNGINPDQRARVENPLPYNQGKGKISPGFNLDGTKDGRATDKTCAHTKFTSYEGEGGIDNQLYLTMACIRSMRPDGLLDAFLNGEIITQQPNRWLVEITGVDDQANDSHVEVTIAHGMDKLVQDARGNFIPGLSQRIDEAMPDYIHHTTGRIVNHVLITDPIPELRLPSTQILEPGERHFLNAQLKLKLSPNGAAGVLAGYSDVERLYRFWAKSIGVHGVAVGVTPPSVYASIQRNADGMKDPKTGKCTAISSVHDIELVRAFIVREQIAREQSASEVSENAPQAPSASPLSYDRQTVEPKLAVAPPAVRLITEAQYLNSLRAIFGPGLRYPAKFPPIHRVGGLLAVGTGSAVVTGGALDQFDLAARAIADQVVAPSNRDFLISCRPIDENTFDDACAGEFLKRVGALLYRRPLTSTELKAYVSVAHKSADTLHGFYPGLSVTLSSLLVAPEFLYVTQPTENVRGQTRLTANAKASRLSLLLWNAYPDQDLLAAAQNGSLNTPKGLSAQVDRMVASPRLAAGVRNFFDDMLMFENFDMLTKDAGIYPSFTQKVGEDAREQTLRTIIAHVVDRDADYRDLFTTRKTFLTNDLGSVYGVKVDRPEGWVPYEFPEGSPRAGLLTQLSFLALYAQPGRSSPTRRGKAIREIFLCQTVPNPPPNVDFSKLEDPSRAYSTTRERLAAHASNPVCAGCHKITDPMGLALENFDGAGIYRTQESKAPIDASGQLDDVQFTSVTGLSQAMYDNPRTARCLSERLASYALGRELKSEDKDWVKYVTDRFGAEGYRVKELLRTIATSNAFYETQAPIGARQKQGS